MRYRVKVGSPSTPVSTYRTRSRLGVWSNWSTWTRPWRDTYAVCWDELHPGPPWRSGGPCDIRTIKTDNRVYHFEVISPNQSLSPNKGEALVRCAIDPRGYFDMSDFYVKDATRFLVDNGLVDSGAYGATGWARARPGQPGADMAQFIAEFRDVPRTLRATAEFFHNSWKAAMSGVKSTSRHAADSWLAANFGWLPFLSDLRKFERTYGNVNRRIKDLRRNNNRWQKRTRNVKSTSDVLWSNTLAGGGHTPVTFGYYTYYFLKNYAYPVQTRGSVTATVQADFRFSGRFKYWIPNIDSDQWEARARQKLYGLNVTPALVWELTPFSWLADWVSNVGDVLSNLDNCLAENLVAKYAYIMGTQSVKLTIESHADNYLPAPFDGYWDYYLTIKDRKPASPFGFALTEENFNLRQWSLLSAVGLQRFH